MSKPCEFVLVPMKLAVRDSVAQIGNTTSKSEASIQRRTALNAGETESSVTDQLRARQQKEYKDTRDFLDTRTSSSRSLLLCCIVVQVERLEFLSFAEQSEIVEVETHRHQQSILPGTVEKLIYI